MSRLQVVVVAEAPVDARFVEEAVRAWQARWIDWGAVFQLRGLTDDTSFLAIRLALRLARERRLPRIRGGPMGLVRQAQLVIRSEQAERGIDGAVLLTDTDGAVTRACPSELPCAAGFPHQSIEAWGIALHAPSDAVRTAEIERLGFDPFVHPQNLSHKSGVPKSSKALVKRHDIQVATTGARLFDAAASGSEAQKQILQRTGAWAFAKQLDTLLAQLSGGAGYAL